MVPAKLSTGTIFDIQGFSVHDGPGCRTLIFFKGCSLQCLWCSNPEGISFFPEILYNVSRCTLDGFCIEACPNDAISKCDHRSGSDPNHEKLHFDRSFCRQCVTFDCISSCCAGALNKGGYEITTDDLYSRITRDRQYWGSQGGMTLTGGEPFTHPEFAKEILQRCYNSFIHTAAETCGNFPWQNISPSLPFLDWLFFDLKHMDPDIHKQMTGSSNQVILSNATRLSKEFTGRMVFRMPVIPGLNDDPVNISEMSDFIRSGGRNEINILPVHHYGREKYGLVGKPYFSSVLDFPGTEMLEKIKSHFEESGIICYIGNDTPF